MPLSCERCGNDVGLIFLFPAILRVLTNPVILIRGNDQMILPRIHRAQSPLLSIVLSLYIQF
jgi:hypothetical protein